MTENDTVEVDRETLDTLREFADTHGDEYAWEDVYHAVEDAREVLGMDPEPYMVWKSHWDDD